MPGILRGGVCRKWPQGKMWEMWELPCESRQNANFNVVQKLYGSTCWPPTVSKPGMGLGGSHRTEITPPMSNDRKPVSSKWGSLDMGGTNTSTPRPPEETGFGLVERRDGWTPLAWLAGLAELLPKLLVLHQLQHLQHPGGRGAPNQTFGPFAPFGHLN